MIINLLFKYFNEHYAPENAVQNTIIQRCCPNKCVESRYSTGQQQYHLFGKINFFQLSVQTGIIVVVHTTTGISEYFFNTGRWAIVAISLLTVIIHFSVRTFAIHSSVRGVSLLRSGFLAGIVAHLIAIQCLRNFVVAARHSSFRLHDLQSDPSRRRSEVRSAYWTLAHVRTIVLLSQGNDGRRRCTETINTSVIVFENDCIYESQSHWLVPCIQFMCWFYFLWKNFDRQKRSTVHVADRAGKEIRSNSCRPCNKNFLIRDNERLLSIASRRDGLVDFLPENWSRRQHCSQRHLWLIG